MKRLILNLALIVFIWFFIWPVLFSASAFAGEDRELTLLYTGDINGFVYPVRACGAEYHTKGGLARLATAVRAFSDIGGPTLVLDRGNFISNTAGSLEFKLEATLRTMKEVHYSAVGIGKNDFRISSDKLAQYLDTYGLPMITSNLVVKKTGEPFGIPYFLTRLDGISIAVLSVLPPGIFDNNPDLMNTFEIVDPAKAIGDCLETIKRQADITILLADLNRDETEKLVANRPGIDIAISKEVFVHAGITDGDPARSTVLAASCKNGISLQKVIVQLHDDGRVVVSDMELFDLTDDVPEDETVNAIIGDSLKNHNKRVRMMEEAQDLREFFEQNKENLSLSPEEYLKRMNQKATDETEGNVQ